MEFNLFDYINDYPILIILSVLILILSSVTPYYTHLETIAERTKALEVKSQEIQEQLACLSAKMEDFRKLADNLYNVHSARQFRNDMRKLYMNKARNQEVIRKHEVAQHAYKNAKNEFTDFVLTLC
jgi:DNA repair exonuclease SbcCD ATPase subunit